MSRITPVTAEAVYELFHSLTNDEQLAFISRLAKNVTAECVLKMMAELTELEQVRFADLFAKNGGEWLLTICTAEAVKVARGETDDNRLASAVINAADQKLADARQQMAELERIKLKQARDRSPDPETIRRNIQIIEMHEQKPHLTPGQLGVVFKKSRQHISTVLKEKMKWRSLASRLATN
jgi:hypothetical protein